MADFAELEAQDGIRFSWNVWPNNKVLDGFVVRLYNCRPTRALNFITSV